MYTEIYIQFHIAWISIWNNWIIRWEIVVIQHYWWNTAVATYMDIGLHRCPPPSRKNSKLKWDITPNILRHDLCIDVLEIFL